MKNKITAGIFILGLLVLGMISYLLWEMFAAESIGFNAKVSQNISRQALNFGIWYYDSQLKLWKYVNDPTDERLIKYSDSQKETSQQFNDLFSLTYTAGPALCEECNADMNAIKEASDNISGNISEVLQLAKIYENAKNGTEEEKSKSIADLREEVFATEKKYNQYKIDQIVTNFNTSQDALTDSFSAQMEIIKSKINIGLLALAGLYMALLALIAVFLLFLVNDTVKCSNLLKKK
jgi:hypothetical protein